MGLASTDAFPMGTPQFLLVSCNPQWFVNVHTILGALVVAQYAQT